MRYYWKYLNTKKLQEHISHASDFDREIFNLKVFTERLWKHKMMQKPGFKVKKETWIWSSVILIFWAVYTVGPQTGFKVYMISSE